MADKLSPQEEQIIIDLCKHTLEQCENALERSQSLISPTLHHHLSVNVVAALMAKAMADTLREFKREFPGMPPPPFEKVLDSIFARIKHLAMSSPAVKAARESGLSS